MMVVFENMTKNLTPDKKKINNKYSSKNIKKLVVWVCSWPYNIFVNYWALESVGRCFWTT